METSTPRELYGGTEDKFTLQSLSNSISDIKRLHNKLDPASAEKADFYMSSLAFLCHLKQDQTTLFRALKQKGDSGCPVICPLSIEIPAITALLDDSGLFQSVLAMLRSHQPPESDPAINAMPNMPQTAIMQRNKPTAPMAGNRKRSASVSLNELSDEKLNKAPKLQHSPAINTERRQNAIGGPIPPEKNQFDFDAAPLAATLLFAAFQHLDHWPAVLVKAYAEDSFGPRHWVDDERCKMLADNLALAVSEETGDLNQETLAAAEILSEVFDNLMRKAQEEEKPKRRLTPPASDNSAKRNSDAASSDSDSGEEECIVEVSSGVTQRGSSRQGSKKKPLKLSAADSDSSSSGDEGDLEEVFVANASSSSSKSSPAKAKLLLKSASSIEVDASSLTSSISPSPMPNCSDPSIGSSYAWHQKYLDMRAIRQRYVGNNRLLAHQSVSGALSHRLCAKAKQNSRLLSTLPTFMCVPGVRSIAAEQLQRWLQSPALAGLGRSLFSSIVSGMRNVEPPLPEDIKAIGSILSMKLKANQLTAHIENVTRIAKSIPTVSVSSQMFLHLLQAQLVDLENHESRDVQSKSHIDFFVSIHSTLPENVASEVSHIFAVRFHVNTHWFCLQSWILFHFSTQNAAPLPRPKALASALLDMLAHSHDMDKMIVLLRAVVFSLGTSYNGRLLVMALLQPRKEMNNVRDAESIARLAYECISLMAPVPQGTRLTGRQPLRTKKQATSRDESQSNDGIPPEVLIELSRDLLAIKKRALHWCVNCYANISRGRYSAEESRRKLSLASNNQVIIGAGLPVYDSILDGHTPQDSSAPLMKLVRCLLFLVGPESLELLSFLSPNQSLSHEESHRINVCSDYGADVDDEMIWTVLKSKALENETAVLLLENIFFSKSRPTPLYEWSLSFICF